MSRPIVLAITGASGAIYAQRLLEVLVSSGVDVQLTISPAGREVIRHELKREIDLDNFLLDSLLDETPESTKREPGRVAYYYHSNLISPIASGSSLTAGMVICPCSGGTLSAIANGTSSNLIHRAADVHLKERRKLIVVPRETPLSLVHLDNMKKITEAGAIVLPASPGWYHGVSGLDDLVDFVVSRILDQLEIENSLMTRWSEKK